MRMLLYTTARFIGAVNCLLEQSTQHMLRDGHIESICPPFYQENIAMTEW